jgi:hypothetical protein
MSGAWVIFDEAFLRETWAEMRHSALKSTALLKIEDSGTMNQNDNKGYTV